MQNGADAQIFKNSGFHDIRILNEATVFDGIELIKTPGRHGTVAPAGDVCGVVFRAPQEPTVYLAGDTIYYEGVKNTIDTYYPDVIIVNACDAVSLGTGRLIMDDEDVYWTHMTAPSATIICVHMDTIAHFNQTRAELKHLLSGFNILNSVRIPNDGETLTFERQ